MTDLRNPQLDAFAYEIIPQKASFHLAFTDQNWVQNGPQTSLNVWIYTPISVTLPGVSPQNWVQNAPQNPENFKKVDLGTAEKDTFHNDLPFKRKKRVQNIQGKYRFPGIHQNMPY